MNERNKPSPREAVAQQHHTVCVRRHAGGRKDQKTFTALHCSSPETRSQRDSLSCFLNIQYNAFCSSVKYMYVKPTKETPYYHYPHPADCSITWPASDYSQATPNCTNMCFVCIEEPVLLADACKLPLNATYSEALLPWSAPACTRLMFLMCVCHRNRCVMS